MPLNNTQYREMVDHALEALPGVWNGRIKQLPAGNTPFNLALQFPPRDERQGLQIIYRQCDIYILGYITTAGTSYVTFDQAAAVPGATRLNYNGDYASLGWKSAGLAVNDGGPIVSVAEVDVALEFLAAGMAAKDQLCVIAIALAEAVRFKTVEKAVREGSKISSDMVDWAQQLTAGNALLQAG